MAMHPVIWRWLWRGLAMCAPLAVLCVPWIMRQQPPVLATAERVVVVTPHGESVRHEFAYAFRAYAARVLKRDIAVEYLTPGGMGEIERVLIARASGQIMQLGLSGTEPAKACFDPTPSAARRAWLSATCSLDMDVLWGGGEAPHDKLARAGFLIDAGVRARHPEWLSEAIIPRRAGGETIIGDNDQYIAACLAVFGIVSHHQRLRERGIERVPTAWSDLADERLAGGVIVADPLRSGAVLSGLERIVQSAQQRRVSASASGDLSAQLEAGWRDGWATIVAIYANARSVADGASRPVREVVLGEAAAAMAIDFHALSETAWAADEDARSGRIHGESATRASFHAAIGGTSVSGDPIALLRGAPNRTAAEAFIDFVLSPDGQRLWNHRPGTAHGPQRYALRRLPVRRDVCTADDQAAMTDPTSDPYTIASGFTYVAHYTKQQREVLKTLVKCCLIDPQPELAAAWRVVIAQGGRAASPQWAELSRCPVSWSEAAAMSAKWNAKSASASAKALAMAQQRRLWCESALARYRAISALR